MEIFGFILVVGMGSALVAAIFAYAVAKRMRSKIVVLSLGALLPLALTLLLMLPALIAYPEADDPPPWTYLLAIVAFSVASLPFSILGGHLAWERCSRDR